MNKVIEWIKGRWKVILIVLLSLMLISKCTSANNYERKLHKAETRIEYVTDSLTRVYSNSAKHIDSLDLVIKEKNSEISLLTKQLNIYVEQNAQLNEYNAQLNEQNAQLNDRIKALLGLVVNAEKENKKDDE